MSGRLQRLIAVGVGTSLLPFLVVLVILIRVTSRGPALYRATRVGSGGRPFVCYKLRTMEWGGGPGPAVSVAADPRVTRLGRGLRRLRLDELPQLWNVVRGQMLLVGPRPEDPRFVDLTDPIHRRVFTATPGITGLTQLVYADEARCLGGDDPETAYRRDLLPAKVALDARYLDRRSTALDAWILGQTIATLLGRGPDRAAIEARLG
jgi:lipopolysaccharide/colanic/teichoic acid biosynthesis glycosyltransferase